ncbi:alpha/beta fold hydrolase [Skermanella sp. TT6]|uniref:Alpha/beta fold hydrolase n=1 Tax=Skermanella cutis TaxID=2775420 RepID=A0ABX7BDS7_9PROT|nr:alpha/beta fold hydrolase [Skermanella sp. TT6]QQP91895.1 alpha/beta fold hydrolase [Skermanella sp. TT6]
MTEDRRRTSPGGATFWADALHHFDAVRRWRGLAMDGMGLGPQESAYGIVMEQPGVRLRRYEPLPGSGPAVLIVPAPIKRGYIWDLLPHVSVVRRLSAEGFRVYMTEWTEPGEAERDFGLADYADRLIGKCVSAVARDSGSARVFLAGHSLGGTLATLFASMHADRVRGLIVVEAPLHFGEDGGALARMVAEAPPAATLREAFGNIPGSFLNLVSVRASPREFNWQRRVDMIASLADPRALKTHLAVERWTLDEFPIAGRFFEDLIERLYRDNQFSRGQLAIGGRPALPSGLAAPLLAVIGKGSEIIPPGSMLPVIDASPADRKLVLDYAGDVGVALQHVGPLIGRAAHEHLWPGITRWMREIVRSEEPGRSA